MQSLKQQIEDLVKQKRGKSDRNLRMIFNYFGLGESKYCTVDSLGMDEKRFSGEKISGARVHEMFRERILKNQEIKPNLLALSIIEQAIEQALNGNAGYLMYSDILTLLKKNGILGSLHPFGLFNFHKYFDFKSDFIVINIEKTEEENYNNHNEFILGRESLKEKIRDDLKDILDLPGADRKPGIFLLNSVFQTENNYLLTFEDTKKFLRGHKDVWYYEENGNFWYVSQQFGTKKGNSLITALRKIKKVGGNHSFEKAILIEVVYKALSRQGNQEVRDAIFPPIHIIRKYFDEVVTEMK